MVVAEAQQEDKVVLHGYVACSLMVDSGVQYVLLTFTAASCFLFLFLLRSASKPLRREHCKGKEKDMNNNMGFFAEAIANVPRNCSNANTAKRIASTASHGKEKQSSPSNTFSLVILRFMLVLWMLHCFIAVPLSSLRGAS